MSSHKRLTTADMTQTLVLEINREDSPQNKAQRGALDLWVNAVNAKGGFGSWRLGVAFQPAEFQDILHTPAQAG